MLKKRTKKKMRYEEFKITTLKFKNEDLPPVNLQGVTGCDQCPQCSQCPQCNQCPQI